MTSEIRYLAQQLLHAGLAPLSERDARVIARVAKRMHIAATSTRSLISA